MTAKRLGTTIRRLRQAQKLTPRELGKKAKVSSTYVALIEAGERKNPSIRIAKHLAKALGVPITALLE